MISLKFRTINNPAFHCGVIKLITLMAPQPEDRFNNMPKLIR